MAGPVRPTQVTIAPPMRDLSAAAAFQAALLGRAPDAEPADAIVESELRDGVRPQT